ncbi:hypothetical protein BH09VER1_BH09VER1_04970 [soil metagenome]
MSEDDNSHASAPTETPLWKGCTSQWVHFWYYFTCGVLAAACLAGTPFSGGLSAIGLVVPVVMWLVQWFVTRSTEYELTSQRLRVRTGILNRRLDEIELFRVRDYVMDQPLFLRLLGRGNLTLITSDVTTPNLVIKAIANVETVREQLRAAVQHERDRKRVRQLDVDDAPAADLN